MSVKVEAEHGVICSLPGQMFGYFGWPSVARMDDGTLVVASSGLRTQHICPFGKTVLNFSTDEGRTWSPPRVLNDSPLDDRDAGVVNLGGKKMLTSWFTSIASWLGDEGMMSAEEAKAAEPLFKGYTDDVISQWLGSWVRLTDDGETWSEPIRVPIFAPHGPIRLASGDLLYLGRSGLATREPENGEIMALGSVDGGRTWTSLGIVPLCDGTHRTNYHEPHVVELDGGKLIGMIRFQYGEEDTPATEQVTFSLFQTESDDGGITWTPARPTGVRGSPPHLLRHSSGAIVCVYGYRDVPYGQRAMISRDDGATWQRDLILRDDGPDWDLGYPASVEMPDGSVFTIYYQKAHAGEKCSLLWTRWSLP